MLIAEYFNILFCLKYYVNTCYLIVRIFSMMTPNFGVEIISNLISLYQKFLSFLIMTPNFILEILYYPIFKMKKKIIFFLLFTKET